VDIDDLAHENISNPCGWDERSNDLWEICFGVYQDKCVYVWAPSMEHALTEASEWLFDQDDADLYTTSEEDMAEEFQKDTGMDPGASDAAMDAYMNWSDGMWTERGWVDEWHYSEPDRPESDAVRRLSQIDCEDGGVPWSRPTDKGFRVR
jgi:hypothetical protein